MEGPSPTLWIFRNNQRWPVSAKGSALILTVVLTTLLAVMGVLFALMSRLDHMAAKATIQDRQLDLAIKTAITMIERQLVLDLPWISPAGLAEYYDYPDQNDAWLASLEPSVAADGSPVWPQITDLTGYIRARGWPITDIPITTNPQVPASQKPLLTAYQADYRPISIDPCTAEPVEQLADADGDGIADSKWVPLEGLSTSNGRRIYLAARIVDNSGMLNINTGFCFDSNDPCLSDGFHQMQIDLAYLSERGDNGGRLRAATVLSRVRSPGRSDLGLYLRDVVWNNGPVASGYLPFDICDELRLRYRYLLNYNRAPARIETFWDKAFEGGPGVPIGTDTYFFNDWLILVGLRPGQAKPERLYDYRHICTVYSLDRLVDPCGLPQVNPNLADVNALFTAFVKAGLGLSEAAQLAVNVRDFVDNDSNATAFQPAGSATTFWGFEPQPFIRQIGFTISSIDPVSQANNEFLVELSNPFDVPVDLTGCILLLTGSRGGRAEVRLSGILPANGRLSVSSKDRDKASLVLALYEPAQTGGFQLRQRYDLSLVRRQAGKDIYLDRQVTDDRWFDWNTVKGLAQYYARPDARWNIIYQQMSFFGQRPMPGTPASRSDDPQTWDWIYSRATRKNYNLASPQRIWPTGGRGLITVGELGRLLLIGPRDSDPQGTIGQQLASEPDEVNIRLDLVRYPQLFRFLAVIGPQTASQDVVKGRININTAGPFVLNRLPWLEWARQRLGIDIGQAIVQYRNTRGAFTSIGQLLLVPQMQGMYGFSGQQLPGPDLTPDGEYQDLEARDLLFSRASNLITVRSDLFTVYLVIRLSEDGPQRRLMLIFDRSKVRSAQDRPRLVAYHLVPDPR